MTSKFSLGRVVITRTAADSLQVQDVTAALSRHSAGDWGDLDGHDRQANDQALIIGARLLSAYTDRYGTKFWIITEADRSATTVLLPDDY